MKQDQADFTFESSFTWHNKWTYKLPIGMTLKSRYDKSIQINTNSYTNIVTLIIEHRKSQTHTGPPVAPNTNWTLILLYVVYILVEKKVYLVHFTSLSVSLNCGGVEI